MCRFRFFQNVKIRKLSFSERPGPFRITIKIHISNIRMLRWSILLGGNKGTKKVYVSVTFLEHSGPNLPIVILSCPTCSNEKLEKSAQNERSLHKPFIVFDKLSDHSIFPKSRTSQTCNRKTTLRLR